MQKQVRLAAALSALFFSFALKAEVTARDFYEAIRNDDLAKLQSYLDAGAPVDLKDSRGTTPLVNAAAIGSIGAVKLLLKAGADVNAKNGFDVTALLSGATDLEKARLLIEAGADVKARSRLGRTPLMMAASHPGSAATIHLLLAKGAETGVADVRGNTALLDAARINDTEAMELLLKHKADLEAGDFAGLTALAHAAANSNLRMVRTLIEQGANVNAANKRAVKVRNGMIAVSQFTPLMAAVSRGSVESVKMLLDAGADVNAKDVRGMTPLMLAASSDLADPKVIRLLLDKGADAAIRSVDNETALDWAKKFNRAPIVAMLGGRPAVTTARLVPAATSGTNPRQAIRLAASLLQSVSKEYFKQSGCVGCHHQGLIGFAVARLASKGISHDRAAAKDQLATLKSEAMGSRVAYLQDVYISVDGLVYTLLAMAESGYPADELTDAMVSAVAARQTAEGKWLDMPIVRPPLEDSAFVTAALAIRAMEKYAIPARKAEFTGRIAKARQWLSETQPQVAYEAPFQLMGLKWADAGRATLNRVGSRLRHLQRADGGWAQSADLSSDAFATATALYALSLSGASAKDEAYRQGVRYLLAGQKDDGSWFVPSRAPKVQPYFQSGFPYNHDQWISAAASAWAIAALAEAVDETPVTAFVQE